jgi:hypothetical protein
MYGELKEGEGLIAFAGEKGANPPLLKPGDGVTREASGFRGRSSIGRGANASPAAGEKGTNTPLEKPDDGVTGEVCGFWNVFPVGRDANPFPEAGEGEAKSGRKPKSAPSWEPCISGATWRHPGHSMESG